MYIESIHLANYRCHASLRVDFKPGFNVVVGVNGSGKTSLLKGICEALGGGFPNFLSIQNGHYMAMADSNIVRLKIEANHGRFRFEPQYPVTVSATGEAFCNKCNWMVSKPSQVDHVQINGTAPGQIWQSTRHSKELTLDDTVSQHPLPVIAFYRANRHWNDAQPHEMQAATARNARIDGYMRFWDASLDSAALQSWVISKCLERFQTSSESGILFDDIHSDELALVNQALSAAIEGIKGLRYDLKQKSLLVEWLDDAGAKRDPTGFEHLSDGQRAVIGLVADLARRMCILNPQLGQDVTSGTAGVVLVDELDMHLHPRWQRILTSGLKRAFPKVQFIVTSHAPQVLGELQPDEIILLRPDGTAHPQVSYGLTSSQILEEIMGAEARSPEVEKLLSELFEALERADIGLGRNKIEELRKTAPGIPELAGAEALLKRKEILGR